MNKKTVELIEELLRNVFIDPQTLNSTTSLTLSLLFPRLLPTSLRFIDHGLITIYNPLPSNTIRAIDLQKCHIVIDEHNVDIEAWYCDCDAFKVRNNNRLIEIDDHHDTTNTNLNTNTNTNTYKKNIFGRRFGQFSFVETGKDVPICEHLLSGVLLLFNYDQLIQKCHVETVDMEKWVSLHMDLGI